MMNFAAVDGQPSGQFPMENPDFLLKNPDFLLKNDDFIIKQRRAVLYKYNTGHMSWGGGGGMLDKPRSVFCTEDDLMGICTKDEHY